MKKYKTGYTSGVYDMFHIGHLNLIRNAKEMCEYLIVGVTTDELCRLRKNKTPVINEKDRMAIVEAIRYVDKVIPQTDMDKLRIVKEYNCDVVFVGSDWKGTDSWNRYAMQFREIGVVVEYLRHTDGISSTLIAQKKLDSGE